MDRVAPEDMQPIASAPRDGTRIVVWREKYGLYSVQWLDGAWVIMAGRTIPTNEVTLWKLPPPPPPPPAPESELMSAEELAEYEYFLELKARFEPDDEY